MEHCFAFQTSVKFRDNFGKNRKCSRNCILASEPERRVTCVQLLIRSLRHQGLMLITWPGIEHAPLSPQPSWFTVQTEGQILK